MNHCLLMSVVAAPLKSESRQIFARHRGARQPGEYHDGSWSGVTLFGSDAAVRYSGFAGSGVGVPRPTAALEGAPKLREFLESLPYRIVTARLMTLPPFGRVEEHTDGWVSLARGFVRMNLLIEQPEGARLTLAGEVVPWNEGELRYAEFSLPHSVVNGDGVRTNVVMEIEVTESLLADLPASLRQGAYVASSALAGGNGCAIEGPLEIPTEFEPLFGASGLVAVERYGDGLAIVANGKATSELLPLENGVFRVRGAPPVWEVTLGSEPATGRYRAAVKYGRPAGRASAHPSPIGGALR